MQINKCRSCLKMLFISLVTAFALTNCMNEDNSMCPIYTHKFIVKALDADNVELDNTHVTDILLSIFDKDKGLLETRSAVLGQSVELYYPTHDKLFVVAWGNSLQGTQTMPVLGKGDLLDAVHVSLVKAEEGGVEFPGDLFHGLLEMITNSTQSESVLFMQRKVASVAITARTLQEFAETSETDGFSYELRARNSEKINYYGMPAGGDVSYFPNATFDTNGDFVAPIFTAFPSLSAIEVDIYFQNRLLKTITSDAQGKPLRLQEGRLLNILIDFRGNVTVQISVTPWGEREVWKEFN